jgi:putative tryptophan/tyrosine transport system substrate-binding protein
MRRREFLYVVGGTTAAWPFLAQTLRAQSVAARRIAILIPFAETDRETSAHLTAFREELRRLGWTDNLQVDVRWGEGDVTRIESLAKELAGAQPDVIVGRSTPVAKALLKATSKTPVIFLVVSDPVGDELVASVARPGGNVTGFTNVEASLGGKWVGLLREIAPGVNRVAVLFNPKTSPGGGQYYGRLIEQAASTNHIKAVTAPVHDRADIERAITSFAKEPNGGLVVVPDVVTGNYRDLIIALAAEYRLPAIYAYRYIAGEGGLVSYGVDVSDLYRRTATYVDRILRGAKPGELPVQAPIKFELAINLKTAKALGLTVPATLLGIADEVIE